MIREIKARKIFDSHGNYTIEVAMYDGKFAASASSPSGTSKSSYEAVAFPSGGIDTAIRKLNSIKHELIGMDAADQKGIDEKLHEIDGMRNFSNLGSNASTAVSIANAKLAAMEESLELYEYIYENFTKRFTKKSMPLLLGNLIGGGVHSSSNMSIQEILACPFGTMPENAYINVLMHREIGEKLHKEGIAAGVNIENAWVTPFNDEKNLSLAYAAAKKLEKEFNVKIGIGADFAAHEFYANGVYSFASARLDSAAYIKKVEGLISSFGLSYIEDPLNEDDFKGFAEITRNAGSALVAGDDIYATQYGRLEEGIEAKAANAVLVKVNQAGTLTDAIRFVELAKKNGLENIVSHRSMDTNDNFIAHLAVAFGSKMIKCGIIGGERTAKVNELMRINELERK